MDESIKIWLADIQSAIGEIKQFIPLKKDFTWFCNDLKTIRAVERNLEIIGEAINRIVQKSPGIKLKNTRKIVDTRNRIIHGYDTVSDEILWAIVIRDLPELEKEVNELLDI
ncbi:MAG: antitoxin [Candidatus Marinimicrobia bacterium CG08_land_8_20_14_0_20_45_22]|nr:MAG: antitoxin [Candidatus Marinimicrobia bacterium CG08_land_8_20_14_0_20_45_22]